MFVEPAVHALHPSLDSLVIFDPKHSEVDFVITLGGDGTILYAASQFPATVPPILSFSMGTLGFLTPFAPDAITDTIQQAILGGLPVATRRRITGVVRRAGATRADAIEYTALNEIVLQTPTLSEIAANTASIECTVDNTKLEVRELS